MTDRLDFEVRLEERLRARAAIASRPFDAAAIAHQAVVAGGRRRSGRSLRLADLSAFRWVVLALLALALVAAAVVVGSRLLERRAQELGNWTITGAMINDHAAQTATLLPDGRVLVAGGVTGDGALAPVELYDPSAGSWTATGGMIDGRYESTATLLPDGRVLLAGGNDDVDGALDSAELYDPASGTWTTTGRMTRARHGHTATLLVDGRVLVAGGAFPATSELYDPRNGTWTATGNMLEDRFYSSATLLLDGTVLVAGGGDQTPFAELYDPASGTWTATGGMIDGRLEHTATLLPDGTVLVVGGGDADAIDAELYDPRSGTWTATEPMNQRRGSAPTATLLPDGTVLVTGGDSGRGFVDGADPALNSAEVYDPRTGTWTATPDMSTNRRHHTATLLPDGRVLVAGGAGHDGIGGSAELYHPGTGN